jgi:Hypoxanthine-guanine phosphoribosyltransferase
MDTEDVSQDLKEILLTESQIRERIAEISREIERDLAGETPLLVGVLRGAVMVMADLSRELKLPVEMDWMAVSSYGNDHKSSGVVKILKDLDTAMEGRHVVIVEDIVDSGLTLSWLLQNFRSREHSRFRS